MTAIWGPLGWMTLHSIATCYSEVPTASERALMNSFLDLFRDTITCHYCKDHFTAMLENYRKVFPNMLQSRQEFVLFTFRAHNAVNRRLNKPIYSTVEECMNTLLNNIQTRTAKEYRQAYYMHIRRYWSSMQDITGVVAVKKILEMMKIENEYIASRDTNFAVTIRPDVVVLPRDTLEKDPGEIRSTPLALPRSSEVRAGFRVTTKGIRLR